MATFTPVILSKQSDGRVSTYMLTTHQRCRRTDGQTTYGGNTARHVLAVKIN